MTDAGAPAFLIGEGILSLVTTGMYDNPLAIYREYLQNAADAAAESGVGKRGRVDIEIDPATMRVRIRDDGYGLSEEEAARALLPIARSQKRRGRDRGFRGIGRLSGLAFAETVTFLTRARSEAPVSRIIWNGPKLREGILKTGNVEAAIRRSVTVEVVSGDGYLDHFFEVEVAGIGRHAAGLLLNREAVRAYVAEVCPVPLSKSFPFAAEVGKLFRATESPLVLDVFLDGEAEPVTRRHCSTIRHSDALTSIFSELERIRVPSADRNDTAALGWIAHSSYLGTIPKDIGIRGIRAREGNIQIGGEAVFESLFPEERFNRWCVGEIHILDSRIVPNGRRDYFEPSPHTRNLENRLAAIFHGVAVRCRNASSTRNSGRKLLSALQRIEDYYELAASGYLSADDAKAIVADASSGISEIRRRLELRNDSARSKLESLRELESKLREFKAKPGRPPFGNMTKEEVYAYRQVFHAIVQVLDSPRFAKETIEAVLSNT